MTFYELAEAVLRASDIPLTANEIWARATEQGLDQHLATKGKTPWATLGARLYVIVKENPDFIIGAVGRRPQRFYIRGREYANFDDYARGKAEEETANETPVKHLLIEAGATEKNGSTKSDRYSKMRYLEKELHPFLSHFALYRLSCHTKTIHHSTSGKREYGEWVHPDMVGCVFPIDEWDPEVLQLSAAIGNTSVKFLSFEIKRELNLSTLRENFFQAVSNSSWANESYLAAADISKNEDFLSELSRLSTSFGIGIIRLDIEDPNSSEVLFPAKFKEYLDWETINKLTMNKDFRDFLKRVRNDLRSNEIRREWYDPIYNDDDLIRRISQRTNKQ